MWFLLLACAPTPDPTGRPLRCNGHAELCERPLDQVAFPTTHNAMSSQEEGWSWPNQDHAMHQQLDDGVRAMLLDTHDWYGEPHLCHGECDFGATPLHAGLEVLREFLATHPHELLFLIIEDHIDSPTTAQAFEEAGLTRLLYTHTPQAPWPTLGELIRADTRLVVSAEGGAPPPDWYHNVWTLASDTPYSFAEPAEFSCELNRGAVDNPLLLLNHWINDPLPRPENAALVNSFEVLHGRATQCEQERGQLPNFVAVDFYGQGDLFEVVRTLNGL